MIKKALVTVMAAGALSVPLAGVAWGGPDPSHPNGIGSGGVPGKAAGILQQNGIPVVGNVTPGAGNDGPVSIPGFRDIAKLPGSVPDSPFLGVPNPGSGVRAITPGCANGSLGCQ